MGFLGWRVVWVFVVRNLIIRSAEMGGESDYQLMRIQLQQGPESYR